jgi:large subunit ribosomal protein L31
MKKDTHPKWYPDAKVFVDGKQVMTIGSTMPEIRVEIWSGTHPFYTGTQRLVDTEGQVDRFMRRLQKREQLRAEQEQKKRKLLRLILPSMRCHSVNGRRKRSMKRVSRPPANW